MMLIHTDGKRQWGIWMRAMSAKREGGRMAATLQTSAITVRSQLFAQITQVLLPSDSLMVTLTRPCRPKPTCHRLFVMASLCFF